MLRKNLSDKCEYRKKTVIIEEKDKLNKANWKNEWHSEILSEGEVKSSKSQQ